MTRSLPLLGGHRIHGSPGWAGPASSYRRRWFTAALATVIMLMGGCGGGGGDGDAAGPPKTPATPGSAATEAPTTEAPTPTLIIDPTPEGDLSGVWSGTWTSTNPDDGSTGTFEIQWAQAGSALSGTITVNGTPCLTTGAITGTLAGDAIEFGSIQGQFDVDFSGTVAGETMSGTYSTSCGPAEGDWEAAKTA